MFKLALKVILFFFKIKVELLKILIKVSFVCCYFSSIYWSHRRTAKSVNCYLEKGAKLILPKEQYRCNYDSIQF